MIELFLKITNMSISASWLVVAVLVLRLLMKKAPKWVSVLLWGIVAIRLVCPISIESAISLIPSAETIPMDIEMDETPAIYSEVNAVNNVNNPVIHSFAQNPVDSANTLQMWIQLVSILWIAGMAILLIYTIISYLRLYRKVDTAVIYKNNIFQSENVVSPFVLGIIKPRIYLPFHINEQSLENIIVHEQTHIRRKDHWWKPLGFLILTIHWFNPLMWIAYVLLCRDIELACDEKVIKELGCEQRADYTQALVDYSVNRRMIAACPIAFGEVGVKERVKSVMNYKKPAFWIIVVAVISCAVVAVCFLTNPKTSIDEKPETINDKDSQSTTVENIEKENIEKEAVPTNPPQDSDKEVKGKTYLYEKEGFMGDFQITLYDDGTFTYYEGAASSYLGVGKWSQKDNVITLNDDETNGYDFVNHFKVDGDNLIFTKKDSSNFMYVKVADGECFKLTEEKLKSDNADEITLDNAISTAILSHYAYQKYNGLVHVESHVILANECKSGTPLKDEDNHAEEITVYLLVLQETYNTYGGELESVGGSYIPTAITFSISESGEYIMKEYWEPRDGSFYVNDIRVKFPGDSADDAINSQKYVDELDKQNIEKVKEYMKSNGTVDSRIEELIDIIQSSPATSSNPGDYIAAHENEYQELLSYGEYTLRYCFSKFLSGGETGLNGHIMRIAIDDIAPNAKLEINAENGQKYFDEWKAAAIRVGSQHEMEWIQKNEPAIYLLLQMIDE